MLRIALLAAGLSCAAVPALGAETKSASGPAYQRFGAVTVGQPLPGGRRGVLTVEVGVESKDADLAGRVKLMEPRLRAAWFDRLSRIAAGSRPGAPPEADVIARELQAETDRVMGRKGATFLLGSLIVR